MQVFKRQCHCTYVRSIFIIWVINLRTQGDYRVTVICAVISYCQKLHTVKKIRYCSWSKQKYTVNICPCKPTGYIINSFPCFSVKLLSYDVVLVFDHIKKTLKKIFVKKPETFWQLGPFFSCKFVSVFSVIVVFGL